VARKHWRVGLNFMELISDGNITLMRAVEGFDIHKGNRFSTYATLALMRGFARSVPEMRSASRRTTPDEVLSDVSDSREELIVERLLHRDQVSQLLSRLDDREQTVLRAHYGLDDDESPASYEELGQRLGLSKQRVRQIEQTAIAKLRTSAS
jgi:RNA polymerase primary sigma factor/RNA polymerase sigma factor